MRFVKRSACCNSFITVALISAAALCLISCSDEGPNEVHIALVGQLRVNITTAGEDKTVVYALTIDDNPPFTVGVNTSSPLREVPAGAHQIRLSGLPTNCTIPNASTIVQVDEGMVAEVGFHVTCVARIGSILVTTATTGPSPDPDGYVIMIDDHYILPVAANGQGTVAGLREGSYRIRLGGMSPNCVGGGEVTRAVSFGFVANVLFPVQCPALGSLRVSVSTTGQSIDANGYRVRLAARSLPIASNGELVVDGISVGTHGVYLDDLAVNCTVTAPALKNVNISLNERTDLEFGVTCAAPTMIAYSRWESNRWDIFVAQSNGTGITRLTQNAGFNHDPAWSKDGRIAFGSSRDGNSEIYVMNADGSGVQRLTNNAFTDRNPSWSPDGSRIAFISSRDGNDEIYVMNSDGTGVLRLTSNVASDDDPAWSPDGSKLALIRQVGGVHQLHVMNADGTGAARISSSGLIEFAPAWSPDGSMLAFTLYSTNYYYYYPYYNPEVHIMSSDGIGGSRRLVLGRDPVWSPNGDWIAYVGPYTPGWCDVGGCYPLSFVDRNGLSQVTVIAGNLMTPSWRW